MLNNHCECLLTSFLRRIANIKFKQNFLRKKHFAKSYVLKIPRILQRYRTDGAGVLGREYLNVFHQWLADNDPIPANFDSFRFLPVRCD